MAPLVLAKETSVCNVCGKALNPPMANMRVSKNVLARIMQSAPIINWLGIELEVILQGNHAKEKSIFANFLQKLFSSENLFKKNFFFIFLFFFPSRVVFL